MGHLLLLQQEEILRQKLSAPTGLPWSGGDRLVAEAVGCIGGGCLSDGGEQGAEELFEDAGTICSTE